MLRRVNFYSILCFAFGLSVIIILAGNRHADNTYCPPMESRRNIKNSVKMDDGDDGLMLPIPTNSYNSSPDIDKLLDKTRSNIKSEIFKYNFTYPGVSELEDLRLESGGRPIRSLIISTWRSGSTFLAEVFNAIPCTFYHYEPLLKYRIANIRGPPFADIAMRTIKSMFMCNYEGMDEYFEYGRIHTYQFSHNTRLWDHCKYRKDLCLDPDFTSKICRLYPIQTMKVVRIRLRVVREILEDKELNVKLVLLIRDPRGVMQSRQHCTFCKPAPDCWQPEMLCADMISDYIEVGSLLPKYSDRLMVIRYEELALKPNATAHKILKFLKLNAAAAAVEDYLKSHTNMEEADIYSTFRVTSDVPFRWTKLLDFDYVHRIQTACKQAMDLWGYRIANNATHMTSKHFNPVDNYTITNFY